MIFMTSTLITTLGACNEDDPQFNDCGTTASSGISESANSADSTTYRLIGTWCTNIDKTSEGKKSAEMTFQINGTVIIADICNHDTTTYAGDYIITNNQLQLKCPICYLTERWGTNYVIIGCSDTNLVIAPNNSLKEFITFSRKYPYIFHNQKVEKCL